MRSLAIVHHKETLEFREHLGTFECQRCDLGDLCRTKAVYPVVSRGVGRIMFIGKHPAPTEHNGGVPMTGLPGSILEKNLWTYARLTLEHDCYITNINKCNPDETINIKKHQKKACAPYLINEIDLVDPAVIVFMGKDAYLGIGDKNSWPGLSKPFSVEVRGREYPALVINSPAYAAHDPSKEREMTPQYVELARMVEKHTDHYDENPELRADVAGYLDVSFDDREYICVQTRDDLRAMIEDLRGAKLIALDTETTGLETWIDDFEMLGIALAGSKTRGYYIPLGHELDPTSLDALLQDRPNQLPIDTALKLVNWIDKDLEIPYVLHNYPYDYRVFKYYGYDIRPRYPEDSIHVPDYWIHDSQIMCYLEDERDLTNLKDQTYMRFYYRPTSFQEVSDDKKQLKYTPIQAATEYAGDDVMNTFSIFEDAAAKVKTEVSAIGNTDLLTKIYPVEIQAARIMGEAQQIGMVIDEDALATLDKQVTADVKRYQEELDTMCNWVDHGSTFQIRNMLEQLFQEQSSDYVSAFLNQKEFNTPFLDDFSERYGDSRDSSHLKMLVEFYGKQHGKTGVRGLWTPEKLNDYIKLLLSYRLATKIKASYVDSLYKHAHYQDGLMVIHGGVNTIRTTSGRMAMHDPNLQNLPRSTRYDVRKLFVPRPGNGFTKADWDSMEMVVAAAIFGDEVIQDILQRKMKDPDDPYGDMHRVTASQVYGKAPDQVTEKERQSVKSVNFGAVYGISKYGLAAQLTENLGRDVNSDEAQEMLDGFFKKYAGLKQGFDEAEFRALRDGYLVNLYGRVRHIGKNANSGTVRSAINFLIQGTCAQIMKESLAKVDRTLLEKRNDVNVATVIHDEIILEHPRGKGEEYGQILKDAMCHPITGKLTVNLTATPDIEWPNLSKSNGLAVIEDENGTRDETAKEHRFRMDTALDETAVRLREIQQQRLAA